jgi:hypothetical protein
MLLCDFVRSSRWGTAQFVGGFLHRSLDSSVLILYRLLACNLLFAYPSAELFLLKSESARYKNDLQLADALH